jgi:hypothetical protein
MRDQVEVVEERVEIKKLIFNLEFKLNKKNQDTHSRRITAIITLKTIIISNNTIKKMLMVPNTLLKEDICLISKDIITDKRLNIMRSHIISKINTSRLHLTKVIQQNKSLFTDSVLQREVV